MARRVAAGRRDGVTAAVGTDARLRDAAALLAGIGECKRVRSAGARESVAAAGFRRSWTALLAGADPETVALRETATALAAARLGAVDAGVLARCGLSRADAAAVLLRAFDAADGIDEPLRARLRDALAGNGDPLAGATGVPLPWWVDALAAQPRAGATRPGHPRLVLEPAETHAEHCWVVAVGAVLAAEPGADVTAPFTCGLAHHLHNATLPDSGFAGEVLLGEHLDTVIAITTRAALRELPEPLRATVAAGRELLAAADTPEARAFHAADVLDRVLQQRYHAQAAAFTLEQALEELELVHAGPLQAYGMHVLRAAGLR